MSDESENLQRIFEEIININSMWKEIKFVRKGQKLTIQGVDQHDSKFTWMEEPV